MTQKLVTPKNLSMELLKSIFDEASIETVDAKNGLIVKKYFDILLAIEEGSDLVWLKMLVKLKPETSELFRLQTVNMINNNFDCIKAAEVIDDGLVFSWEISIDGGITKKALLKAVMRFYKSIFEVIESVKDVIDSLLEMSPKTTKTEA